nr:hypothetical protein BaRGS_032314 [Batillaria attramentaria]
METLRAWYRDDVEENLQDLHQKDSTRTLTPEEVFEKSGLRYWRIERSEDEDEQTKLKQEGNYNHFDWLDVSRETLPDYDEKLKSFYREHLHKDEEIRLITAGSCFFEIRDYSDQWIRLHLRKGDLINLPPACITG